MYTTVMRYRLYGIFLGSCVVGFLWLSGYGGVFVERASVIDSFNVALAQITSCMNTSNTTQCARPAVVEMLREKNGIEVMDALSKILPPSQCHFVGHIVGQQIYLAHPDVEEALTMCDRSCDSACVHGIIGTTFAQSLGYQDPDDSDFDLKHLSPVDIGTIGAQLCSTPAACHGVGHTLFQIYKKFEPAFAMCRQIGGASVYTCYHGVTMEYPAILVSRSTRSVAGVEYPDPEKLSSLCTFAQPLEARSCFRYFPRMVIQTLARDSVSAGLALQRVQEICTSYTSAEYRISCFAGIGSHRAVNVRTDTATAVRGCEGLPTTLDQKACILGTLDVATEDRQLFLAQYCAAQTTTTLQSFCYQGLFFSLYAAGARVDVQRLCTEEKSICAENSLKHNIDSWEQLKADFEQ